MSNEQYRNRAVNAQPSDDWQYAARVSDWYMTAIDEIVKHRATTSRPIAARYLIQKWHDYAAECGPSAYDGHGKKEKYAKSKVGGRNRRLDKGVKDKLLTIRLSTPEKRKLQQIAALFDITVSDSLLWGIRMELAEIQAEAR